MEATLEIFTEKISSALNNTDDTELQLKLQAAQHEHELKMLSMFTQFLTRSNSPCPPFHQAPVQLSQYNPRPFKTSLSSLHLAWVHLSLHLVT